MVTLTSCIFLGLLSETTWAQADPPQEDPVRMEAGVFASFVSAPGNAVKGSPGGAVSSAADAFSGASTSEILLVLPPGTKTPIQALSLNYNSRRGNGIFGLGWALDIPQIVALTGVKSGASSPQFALQGGSNSAELVKATTPDEFRARVERTFMRFYRRSSPSKVVHWEVVTQQGVRFVFGGTSDARVLGRTGTPAAWLLESAEDQLGNRVRITYERETANAMPLPKRITFDSSVVAAVTPRIIELQYEARPETVSASIPGAAVATNKRVSRISIQVGNAAYDVLNFNYQDRPFSFASPAVSLLRTVTVQTGVPGALPFRLAELDYGDVPTSMETGQLGGSPSLLLNDSLSNCLSGNFAGDGRINLLCHKNDSWKLLEIAATGTSEISLEQSESLPNEVSLKRDCVVGDFQGLGKSSVACHSSKGWSVLTLIGNKLPSVRWSGPALNGQCLILDVNDDAKMDFACQKEDGSGLWRVSTSTGSEWALAEWPNGPRGGFQPPSIKNPSSGGHIQLPFRPYAQAYCLAGDFNGDRLGDVACYRNNSRDWEIGYSTGSGWKTTAHVAGPIPEDMEKGPTKCTSFDLDADGRADIACATKSRKWSVSMPAGVAPRAWEQGPPKTFSEDCLVGDVNSDGRADFFCNTEKSDSWTLFLNSGAGWKSEKVDWVDLGGVTVNKRCVIRDSGYQASQFLCSRVDGVIERIESGARFPNLLGRVTGTLGGITRFEYDSSNMTIDTRMPAVPVVTKMTVDSGSGFEAVTHFSYFGGRYHTPSRSFRGFGVVHSRKDAGNGVAAAITKRRFYQGGMNADGSDDPDASVAYLSGREISRELADADGVTISKQEYRYRRSLAAPYFAPLGKIDTFACALHCNLVQRDEFLVRPTGEVESETRTYYGPTAPASRKTERSFVTSMDGILRSFVSREMVKSLIGAEILSDTRYYYDGDRSSCATAIGDTLPTAGLLTRISRIGASGSSEDTGFEYDQTGNITCMRDARGHVSKFSVDATTGFVTDSTNAIGQTTRYEYYGVSGGFFGQVKSIIGSDGIKVESDYDQLRRLRLVRVNGSADAIQSFEYVDVGNPAQQKLVEVDAVGNRTTTRFNGDGNPIQIVKTLDSRHEVVYSRQWQPGTLQVSSSLPAFSDSHAAPQTQFQYDAAGRVSEIIQPSGRVDRICYFGLTEFVLRDGKVRSVATRSAEGHVVELSSVANLSANQCADLASRINPDFSFNGAGLETSLRQFRRDALGRIVEVIDNGEHAGRAIYDQFGRLVSTFDVDRGLTKMAYNEVGKVVREVDATGRITTTAYDSIDRPYHVVITGGGAKKEIELTYDAAGARSIGKLTSIVSGDTTETIEYDDFGRPAILGTRVGSVALKVKKSFDAAGRVSQLAYPDGMTVSYTYDGVLLHTIDVDGKRFAEFENPTPTGNYQLARFGNGVTRELTYSGQDNPNCTTPGFRLCSISLRKGADLISSRTLVFSRSGLLDRLEERGSRNVSNKFYHDGYGRLRAHAFKLSDQAQWRNDQLPEVDVSKLPGGQAPAEYRAFEPEAAWESAYALDKWGNIIWSMPSGKISYPDRASPRPNAMTSMLGMPVEYDAAGRAMAVRNDRIGYDLMGKLSTLTMGSESSSFKYGGSEELVSYQVGADSRRVVVGGVADCVSTVECRNSIYAGMELLAYRENGKTAYLHRDHLGSTREVTNGSGDLLASISYGAYGAVAVVTGPEKSKYVAYAGGQPLGGGRYFRLGSRLYSTEVGRFLSPDPIITWNFSPAAGSPYTYAFGDPIFYADPNGEFAWAIVIAGAVIGGVQAARHGDNILEGTLRGAVFGAFVAGGYGLTAAGGMAGGASGFSAGFVMANAGAWGGAAQASIFGGDPSDAAKAGAISALGGYLLGGMRVSVFSNTNGAGGTANYVATSALRGAAVSAAYAAATGQDVEASAMSGARSGAVGAVLATSVHHAAGWLATGKAPQWASKQMVYRYDVNSTNWPGFSLGNVVSGNQSLGDSLYYHPNRTTMDHEASHVWEQSTTLGPLDGYLGSHAVAMLISAAFSYPQGCSEITACAHQNNFMEKHGGWITNSYETQDYMKP